MKNRFSKLGGAAKRFDWLRPAAMLLAMVWMLASAGALASETAAVPTLPSLDAWLGDEIGPRSEEDHRLYRSVSFSFTETGERAALDAVNGYIELLQDPRFNLELISTDTGGNSALFTQETAYYFRYKGGMEMEDLSEMKTFDLHTASFPPQGTVVRVRVSMIGASIYDMYMDYVSEFEMVDEGDCFEDVSYLKEHSSSGFSFNFGF